jgi:two-component system, NarL family, sensor histidine kinase DevS
VTAAPPSPPIDTQWTCCVELLTGSAVWAIIDAVANVRDATTSRAAQSAKRANRAAGAVADDRERIARDLHDTVIRRLFGAGLALETTRALAPEVSERLQAVVTELDEAIRELRAAVFHLLPEPDDVTSGL